MSRETLGHTADSLRSSAARAAEATRGRVEHAKARVDRLLEEQPLILGAIGAAVGAIMGALLPASETEDRVMGRARERVLDSATAAQRAGVDEARGHVSTYSQNSSEARGAHESADRPPSRPH